MNQSIDAISYNLKNIRESRGLSLEQLAELTGVSKSMLRQIEMGKSSPTITTMWKVANGLRISFTALMAEQDTHTEVQSFKFNKPILAEKGHYRIYPLIPFSPQHSFETYYFEIDPNTTFSGEPHNGSLFEYIFVTQGVLEVLVKDKSHQIKSGEFIKFSADCGHIYRCISETPVTAIMQLSYMS